MKPQFTTSLNHPRRAAIFAIAALLWAGCLQSGRSQTSVVTGAVPSKSLIKTGTDIRDGIRKGSLFYAAAPLSEEALKRLDGTPAEASITVPLTVDRVHNRLYVQALLNGHKTRLLLDTGGGPHVLLNEATARSIKLTNKASVQMFGSQGAYTVTQCLAHSLTLGKLTLRQIVTAVSNNVPFGSGTLGTQVFEHYRVTLDFAAQTMILTRGGVPMAPTGAASLSLPFDDDEGYIYVPARVLDQAGWALLDSGSDMTSLSLKAAKAAAAQLPPSDAKTAVMDQKVGMGDTAKKFTVILLQVPVPISMNTGHEDVEFSTTSRVGTSDIDDVLDPGFNAHGNMNALLGFPFLLQFQRVIIDYPNHTLILQYPAHDTPLKVADFLTKHDRAWPGYKWLQKGYAWIEVPDAKSLPASGAPAPQTTVTQTTTTQTTGTQTTVVTTNGTKSGVTIDVGADGITVNGTKYACPPGSSVKVDTDGSVHIVPPPASANPITSTDGQ